MNRTEILKVAKPILFNTDMVRAILDGSKTQTRRDAFRMAQGYAYEGLYRDSANKLVALFKHEDWTIITEYARFDSSDILYVRETWQYSTDLFGEFPEPIYKADFTNEELEEAKEKNFKWKPSIHMPKEAARIFLKVTGVRVERLQDISVKDSKDEGVGNLYLEDCAYDEKYKDIPWVKEKGLPIHQYARLWDSTIKKADLDKYGWDANPWVWVYEFERLEGEE